MRMFATGMHFGALHCAMLERTSRNTSLYSTRDGRLIFSFLTNLCIIGLTGGVLHNPYMLGQVHY